MFRGMCVHRLTTGLFLVHVLRVLVQGFVLPDNHLPIRTKQRARDDPYTATDGSVQAKSLAASLPPLPISVFT